MEIDTLLEDLLRLSGIDETCKSNSFLYEMKYNRDSIYDFINGFDKILNTTLRFVNNAMGASFVLKKSIAPVLSDKDASVFIKLIIDIQEQCKSLQYSLARFQKMVKNK